MRPLFIAIILVLVAASPCGSTDFLGVELCKGSVDTSVFLPAGSPLSLESAEIGRHGDLLLLLKSDGDTILDQIDDLMTGYTGVEGQGDEKKLQWSGNGITAFAQVIKEGYVALAVNSEEECGAEGATPLIEDNEVPDSTPPAESAPEVAAATAVVESETEATQAPEVQPDFKLKGELKHSDAEGVWVDVMGVVVNSSGSDFKVANFDLSSYDAEGDLICVDAISVSQLRSGQERAFRDSIRCTDYVRENVVSWKLQFSGGH